MTVGCCGQFFITPEDNDAGSLLGVGNFVHFNASEGVAAQPFNLPSDGGKTVDVLIVIGKIEWCDVGLGVFGAG